MDSLVDASNFFTGEQFDLLLLELLQKDLFYDLFRMNIGGQLFRAEDGAADRAGDIRRRTLFRNKRLEWKNRDLSERSLPFTVEGDGGSSPVRTRGHERKGQDEGNQATRASGNPEKTTAHDGHLFWIPRQQSL